MTNLSKLFVPIVLGATLALSAVSASDKCYVLAFSSGQESSAYQAGVMKGLVSRLPGDQVKYHAVSGVAGGAVNAAILGGYTKGQEADAINRMEQFWKDFGVAKLYQNWWGGIVAGLFSAGGIYDNSPMRDFLKTQFKDMS